MDITMIASHTRAEKQLSGLGKLVVGALIGFALMFVYLQVVLIKQLTMPLPIFSVISLVLATLVAGRPVGGWRWTPLLGTLWSCFLLIGSLNHVLYELAHPETTHQFVSQLVILALVLVSVVAGIGATVQNYRHPAAERRLPRWVPWSFTVLAGLLVGAVLVSAISRTGSGLQVSPSVLAQLPVVSLDAFKGGEIHMKAGELTALRLENPNAVGHNFDVDEFDVHVAMPGGSESLALFTADTPGTYTFYRAPHYDKATGQGMHGTLIVEP